MRHNQLGVHGELVVKGLSKTVLLENGKKHQSWTEKDLKNIVQTLVSEVTINSKINPSYKSLLNYQVQYGESNFQYLQRLAHQYNEWFYFDGVNLIFGKPNSNNKKPIMLEYSGNISELEMKIQTYNSVLSTQSYDALTDKKYKGKKSISQEGQNSLGNTALKASKSIFNSENNEIGEVFLKDKSSLDNYLQKRNESISSEGNILEVKSLKKELTVGSLIEVNSAINFTGSYHIERYGQYIVIEISHYVGLNGEYYNKLKAIPASVNMLPLNKQITPLTVGCQIAEVINNEDPKQKGRIQVRFLWQDKTMKINWIRVLAPDAGSSELIKKNRGFVFIPEKGDQVMIGFEFDNPNFPFVMGSLFTGKTAEGGGNKNVKKSIVIRSGHTVLLDDTEGEESIVITDKSGNEIFLDTQKGTMRIHAPEELLFESKKIKLKAEETINFEAKQKIRTQAEDTIEFEAINKNITVKAGEKIMQHTKDFTVKADNDLKAIGKKTTLAGESEIIVKGKQKAVVSAKITELEGAANQIKLP